MIHTFKVSSRRKWDRPDFQMTGIFSNKKVSPPTKKKKKKKKIELPDHTR